MGHFAVLAAFLALASGTITTRAATVVVTATDDSGPGSLRAALAAATSGDTVDVTGLSGVISLTGGELLITNNLSIKGPGPDRLAINGNFPTTTSRVFHITNGVVVSISGVAITNGRSWAGGGIINEASTLTLSNCVLSGNRVDYYAGGILNVSHSPQSASLTVINCILSNNLAGMNGGAILNRGRPGLATLTIVGSTFSGNSAGPAGAGALQNHGLDGGNVSCFVTNCTFSTNSTTGGGGAVYNNGFQGNAILVIVNSTLSGNQAGPPSSTFGGGAIFNDGGEGNASALLINTTLSGNSAGPGGAAIRNGSTSFGNMPLTLRSCTLAGNSALADNNIFNMAGQVQIGSTILSSGSPGSNICNRYGTISSLGFNLCSDHGSGVVTNATDLLNLDPLLGPLQDNGGPTFTHALLAASPAMDSGTNLSGALTDARGFPRTFDDPAVANAAGGDGTDIGAYESPGLRILSIARLGDDLQLLLATVPGRTYELHSGTDLSSANWNPLPGDCAAVGGITAVTVTNAFYPPQQFFRVQQLP